MFEVACGNCQGRLLVQQTGVVVACPHCGTHLTIGGPAPAPAPTPPPPAPVQNVVPQPPQVIAPPPPAWTPPPAPTMAPPPQPVAPPPVPAPQPVQPVSPPPVFVQSPVSQFQTPTETEPAAPSWFSPPAAEEPAPVVGEAMPFLGDVQATVPAVNQIDAASAPPAFDATIAVASEFATTTPQVALEPVAAVPTPAVAPPEFFAGPAQPIASVPQPVAPPQWAAPNPGMEYSTAPQVAPAPIAAAPVAYQQPFQQPVAPQPAYAPQPVQVSQPVSQPMPQQAGWYQAPEQPQAYAQPAYGVPDAQSTMSMPGSDAVAQDWSSTPSSLSTAPTPLPIAASGVSRGKFMLLANYASIVTILAAFFAYKAFVAGGASGNDPANLPDVEPKKVGNQIGAVVVEPFRNLDGGQKLTLGETKRFGNLNVTPLSIERGEIEFERLQGVASGLQKPSENVLMLHVKFENVSKDQEIAPLRSLAYKQQGTAFVCVESQRGKKGFKLLHAKLDKEPWRVKGHNIDKTLKPGETLETFIPTASKDVDKLLDDEGEKVWRLWFRKGYSRSNYGVTTLVDIAFNNSDVKS